MGSTVLGVARPDLAATSPGGRRRCRWEAAAFALYAVLLAVVNTRHAMWRDELHSWNIARDSHSLVDLFRHVRYEGHPALWYLLLYLPTRFSWNPVSMQAINFALSLGEAWLIVTARRLHGVMRVLLLFSFFVFYGYGAIARNYMLALLLLTAAARCLLGPYKRPTLGVALLCLAMNAHFFAIPIAGVTFVVLFCFAEPESWKTPAALVRKPRLLILSALMLASLAAAYLTVRPPADLYSPYEPLGMPTQWGAMLVTIGRTWQAFLFLPGSILEPRLSDALLPHQTWSVAAIVSSLALTLLVTATLRTRRAQVFLLATVILDLPAMAIVIHLPARRHYGMLFGALLIALLIDAYAPPTTPRRSWLPARAAYAVLGFLLAVQVLASLAAAAVDVVGPYSESKETAVWLIQSGYARNPMVIEPDDLGDPLLGYMQRPSAYYPACHCYGSFAVWTASRDPERVVTLPELAAVRGSSPLPVVVISNKPFDNATLTGLHLRPLKFFDRAPLCADETFFVYLQWDIQPQVPVAAQ